MSRTQQYLTRFFEEKEIQFQTFRITDKNNTTHFLDTEIVIESIMSTCEGEQSQIANVLRRIDVKDGSVTHYLKFLAYSLVQRHAA